MVFYDYKILRIGRKLEEKLNYPRSLMYLHLLIPQKLYEIRLFFSFIIFKEEETKAQKEASNSPKGTKSPWDGLGI